MHRRQKKKNEEDGETAADSYVEVAEPRYGRHRGSILKSLEETPIGWQHLTTVLLFLAILQFLIAKEIKTLPDVPDPVKTFGISPDFLYEPKLDTDQFVTSRARRLLEHLTSFGIRMAGTPAAEEITVPWLLEELTKLEQLIKEDSPHSFQFYVDHTSGFFDLAFLSGFTSFYSNVSNVLARLDPVGGDTNNALLLNCHFDTTFDTIGASDDAVSCAIMMETLRALMSSPTPSRHSVIFLFNGAEENILQASNGFVEGSSMASTNVKGGTGGHPWAKDVRAFINLESTGSGGREVLFQAGPGEAAPILLRAYAASAPYPHANCLAQELFETEIIPGDTDFRIFRDHGGIPGTDFAYFTNGYVYHTIYDTPDRIQDGSIEHTGANILSLTRRLANSDLSKMPAIDKIKAKSAEKLVYFDVFSKFLVIYPFRTVGLFLNLLAIGGTLWRVLVVKSKSHMQQDTSYGRVIVSALIAHCCATAAAVVCPLLIGAFISMTPACMSWYSKPWLVSFLYALPSICAAIKVHSKLFKFVSAPTLSNEPYTQRCWSAYDASMDAALLMTSFGLAALSFFSIVSSYILCMWTGFPLLTMLLLERCNFAYLSKRNCGTSAVIRHLAATLIPTAYTFYLTAHVIELFAPLLGRAGGSVNPEIVMAALVVLTLSILLMFHCPLAYLCGGRSGKLVKALSLIFGLIIAVTVLTPFGHPYSVDAGEIEGVHAKRSGVQFVMQRFVRKSANDAEVPIRSGFWFLSVDYNGIASFRGLSSELDGYLNRARLACSAKDDPTDAPYCGLPYVYPFAALINGTTHWIDVEPSAATLKTVYWPSIRQMPTSPKLVMGTSSGKKWLLQYRIDCGDTPHCTLYVTPKEHSRILRWYFSNDLYPLSEFPEEKLVKPPPPSDHDPRATWFVLVRFGSSSTATRLQQRSMVLTMEIGSIDGFTGDSLLDIAITSQYFRGSSSTDERADLPEELASFLSLMPDWAFTMGATSLYSSYTF